jgi:hypothetical protein
MMIHMMIQKMIHMMIQKMIRMMIVFLAPLNVSRVPNQKSIASINGFTSPKPPQNNRAFLCPMHCYAVFVFGRTAMEAINRSNS